VLYAANVHLEGSPYKPQERLSQLRSTLAALAKHQAGAGLPPTDCHVVIAGACVAAAGAAADSSRAHTHTHKRADACTHTHTHTQAR
jgi:hypothetical protein